MKHPITSSLIACALFASLSTAFATTDIEKEGETAGAWIEEFQPSTLTKEQQQQEID